jgi:hypothetical protein
MTSGITETECGLYDGTGKPIGGTQVRWEDIEATAPMVSILCQADKAPSITVDRILVLPKSLSNLPALWLAEIVASLDKDEAVAVQGVNAAHVNLAVTLILQMTGGGKA